MYPVGYLVYIIVVSVGIVDWCGKEKVSDGILDWCGKEKVPDGILRGWRDGQRTERAECEETLLLDYEGVNQYIH